MSIKLSNQNSVIPTSIRFNKIGGVSNVGMKFSELVLAQKPSEFSYTPPFNIYKRGRSFSANKTDGTEFDLQEYANISVTKTYYVDSINGSDTNSGTEASPFKTLVKVESQGDADRVIIAENSRFQKNERPTQFTRDIELIGIGNENTRPEITAEVNNQTGTFSVYSGNAYVANIGEFVASCRDLTNLNVYGRPIRLEAVSSAAEVVSTPNSFFTDWPNTDVYVHLFDGRAPDENLRLSDSLVYALTADNRTQYFKNIKFSARLRNSTATGGLKVYIENCQFTGVMFGLNEFIIKNSEGYAGEDCLNYDARNGISTNAIEINVRLSNDFVGTTSGQASTLHNGCNIIRINGIYENTAGQNIADVTSSNTWMLGTTMKNSNIGVSFYFGNTGKAWLESCTSIGNATDIFVESLSTVYIRDFVTDGTPGGAGTVTSY